MQKYTNLCLIFLMSPFFGLSASQQPKQVFEDPYDRTPLRVNKRVVRADKKEMGRELQRQLFEAAAIGKLKKIRKLYAEYGELDMVSDRPRTKGLTPLYMAVKEGKLETVEYLVQHAFVTRLFPREEPQAFSLESAEGSQAGKPVQSDRASASESATAQIAPSALPKPQLENASKPNTIPAPQESDESSKAIESLLDVAIRYGHTDVALLLSQFIPLWMPNGDGKLPVCNALRSGRADIAKALILAHSSNIQHLLRLEGCKGGQSALICARAQNNDEIARLIVEILAKHKPQDLSEKEADQLGTLNKSARRVNLTSPWLVVPGLCVAAGLLAYFARSKSDDGHMAEQLSYFGYLPWHANHKSI